MSQADSSSGFLNNLKVIWHLTMNRIQGKTHQERLESFYKGQADEYDDFRKKLLHGRQEMFTSLPLNDGAIWVDLGAGTGSNAEYLSDSLSKFKKVYQVDLCSPLLEVGNKRIKARGWTNVETVHADATAYVPPEKQVDVVTCSYSLTMIPDWFATMDQAYKLLKPGGVFGIVDFYVSRKWASEPYRRHSWFTRTFWQTWFAMDNVFLDPDHIPYLERHFETIKFEEHYGKVPFIPFIRAPYYIYLGRKPLSSSKEIEASGHETGQVMSETRPESVMNSPASSTDTIFPGN
jgi:S-adenosylmethionine-diacylgycerolhomoserine-N-methlytransferase